MRLTYLARTIFCSALGYVLTLVFLLLGTEANEWFALNLPLEMLWLVFLGMPAGALLDVRGNRR